MFTVKKVITFERYCTKGHTPLPDLWPRCKHSVGFCHICGMPLQERPVPYDAAYCTDCNHPVDPSWNCCPCCGQGRETRGRLKFYNRYQRLIDLLVFIPLKTYISYQRLRHPSHYRCPKNRQGHLWIVKDGKAECKFCQQPMPRSAPDATGVDR